MMSHWFNGILLSVPVLDEWTWLSKINHVWLQYHLRDDLFRLLSVTSMVHPISCYSRFLFHLMHCCKCTNLTFDFHWADARFQGLDDRSKLIHWCSFDRINHGTSAINQKRLFRSWSADDRFTHLKDFWATSITSLSNFERCKPALLG